MTQNNAAQVRPFNFDHAKAGAPVVCRNRKVATILKFDGKHKHYPMIGHYGPTDEASSWTMSGLVSSMGITAPLDLFMAPLGYIDGRPAFVGDILVDERGREFKCGPRAASFVGCKWPTPKIAYPESRMSDSELIAEFSDTRRDTRHCALRNVANAAIRHAIDAGQVTITGANQKTVDLDKLVHSVRLACADAAANAGGKMYFPGGTNHVIAGIIRELDILPIIAAARGDA